VDDDENHVNVDYEIIAAYDSQELITQGTTTETIAGNLVAIERTA
jgi:hypothetical protein